MIDNAFLITKPIFGFISVWAIYSASKGKPNRLAGGVILFMAAGFMTGAEMVTDSEQPWSYLVLTGSEQDWNKAFFGGVMMVIQPLLLLAAVARNSPRLLKRNCDGNSVQSYQLH